MDPKLRPSSSPAGSPMDAKIYDDLAGLEATADFHAKQGRSTGRCVLSTPTGAIPVYVKRYYQLPWWQRWFGTTDSYPGPSELANIQRAMHLGIKVAEPVAAGADPARECKSILVLHSLEGYTALHHYLPSRWNTVRHSREGRREWQQFKRTLVGQMAEMVRRLHAADLYHRDLYLCHFFLREDGALPNGFDLVLIDWGRLKSSKRRRWLTKDLAQLLFSTDLPGITQTDRLRFACCYFGVDSLRQVPWPMRQSILLKSSNYHRHERRTRRRKAA
jgi:heptose I phosphotransferase